VGAVLEREVTITSLGEATARPDVTAQARLSGLRDFHSPTLEAVERRRWQLWLLSIVFLLGASALVAIASLWPDVIRRLGFSEGWVSPGVFRGLLVGLTGVFGVYTVDKEKHLRRLTRLLVDERVLTAALSNRLSEVSALLEAGKAMNSVLELDAVLDIILNSAISLLEAEGGSIMLSVDDEKLRAVCVRSNDFAVGAESTYDQGIAGRVARSWEPLLVTGQLGGRQKKVDTAMCVPLLHRSQLLGVLNINGSAARRFTEYDLRALSLFAEQAAAAIANARLYEIERLHVAELVEGELRKTEFLAGVSHDLRTPLTSLIGCTKMLQRSGLSQEHRLELAAMVDRQAHRLTRMIADLLTAARLEAETPPALEPVDLAAIARELAKEFALAGMVVNVEAPTSVVVDGRPDSLRRIVTNLVENAFKHGSPPVVVSLRMERGGHVYLDVRDHGIGVPAEDRDKVFERFCRLDKNRQTPGIGLGLSIVQGLVVGCGGKVWCDAPDEGEGTVMRVRLRAS
jgi:K+-sensing histidine kinase KdpD